MSGALRRWLQLWTGLLAGAVTAAVELSYLLGLGPLLLLLRTRPGTGRSGADGIADRIESGARRLAEVEWWRLAVFLGSGNAADYSGQRAVRYLALRWPVGLLGGSVPLLLGWGLLSARVWPGSPSTPGCRSGSTTGCPSGRWERAEIAAYFVVSEAVTNAAKHARAGRVDVEVALWDGRLVVTVHDDGVGGADPAGGGLSGLARRVAALDGRFRVRSPVGGPTTVVAELPCG